MKNTTGLAAIVLTMTLAGCAHTELKPDTELNQSLDRAESRKDVWLKAITAAPAGERDDLVFLVAHMPEHDLKSLDPKLVLDTVRLAQAARAKAPWGKDIPDSVYRNAILPYASINEKREDWRSEFAKTIPPLIEGCTTPGDAALAINAKLFKLVNVQYHPTKRPKPDQSPSESIAAGYASCSGLSVLLVDACRAVGVPARIVGTPEWVVPKGDANGNHGGNHTWVEVWDKQWHVLGASEVSKLDETWFLGNASLANTRPDEPGHHIYATTWEPKPNYFHMIWAPQLKYVSAENVSAMYAGRKVYVLAIKSKGQLANGHAQVRHGDDLVAEFDLSSSAWKLVLPTGQEFTATVINGQNKIVRSFKTADQNDGYIEVSLD